MAVFDQFGRQIPDPRPVEIPSGLNQPLSIHEEIKRFVRFEISRRAEEQGVETFEEADDFEVEDEEPEFQSPYEVVEMQPEAFQKDASFDPPAKPSSPQAAEEATAGAAVPEVQAGPTPALGQPRPTV